MKRVALVAVKVSGYYEDYSFISNTITDWAEISDEDYTLLIQYPPKDYVVLVRPDTDEEATIIVNSVAKALVKAKQAQKEKEELRKAMEEQKQREAKRKKAREYRKFLKLKEAYEAPKS